MVRVRTDWENNAEEWWDALRADYPELHTRLDCDEAVELDPAELEDLKNLPGWDGGPKYAPHPLIVVD